MTPRTYTKDRRHIQTHTGKSLMVLRPDTENQDYQIFANSAKSVSYLHFIFYFINEETPEEATSTGSQLYRNTVCYLIPLRELPVCPVFLISAPDQGSQDQSRSRKSQADMGIPGIPRISPPRLSAENDDQRQSASKVARSLTPSSAAPLASSGTIVNRIYQKSYSIFSSTARLIWNHS